MKPKLENNKIVGKGKHAFELGGFFIIKKIF